jgi:hypothetical protein
MVAVQTHRMRHRRRIAHGDFDALAPACAQLIAALDRSSVALHLDCEREGEPAIRRLRVEGLRARIRCPSLAPTIGPAASPALARLHRRPGCGEDYSCSFQPRPRAATPSPGGSDRAMSSHWPILTGKVETGIRKASWPSTASSVPTRPSFSTRTILGVVKRSFVGEILSSSRHGLNRDQIRRFRNAA